MKVLIIYRIKYGTVGISRGFSSSDPITSHNTGDRDTQDTLGYDYFNYCNENISGYPDNIRNNNYTGCDFQIGSMYSEYHHIQLILMHIIVIIYFMGQPKRCISTYIICSDENMTFNSTLFGLNPEDRMDVTTMRDPENDYANMEFPR